MRLENIREIYPEAFQIFYKWWRNVSSFKNRDLYEFFDEQEIKVWVMPHLDKFQYDIISHKRIKIAKRIFFNTRTEAEEAGFTKCFEILERKSK